MTKASIKIPKAMYESLIELAWPYFENPEALIQKLIVDYQTKREVEDRQKWRIETIDQILLALEALAKEKNLTVGQLVYDILKGLMK